MAEEADGGEAKLALRGIGAQLPQPFSQTVLAWARRSPAGQQRVGPALSSQTMLHCNRRSNA